MKKTYFDEIKRELQDEIDFIQNQKNELLNLEHFERLLVNKIKLKIYQEILIKIKHYQSLDLLQYPLILNKVIYPQANIITVERLENIFSKITENHDEGLDKLEIFIRDLRNNL